MCVNPSEHLQIFDVENCAMKSKFQSQLWLTVTLSPRGLGSKPPVSPYPRINPLHTDHNYRRLLVVQITVIGNEMCVKT